jgi:hypothetical protein
LHVGKLPTTKLNGAVGIKVVNVYETSIRFKAKPLADSGSECGTGNVPPDGVQVEVGDDPLPLPKFREQI